MAVIKLDPPKVGNHLRRGQLTGGARSTRTRTVRDRHRPATGLQSQPGQDKRTAYLSCNEQPCIK